MAGGGKRQVAVGGWWWWQVAGGRWQVVPHHLCRTQLPVRLGGGRDPRRAPRRLRVDLHPAVAVVKPANGFARMVRGRRGLQVVAGGGV